jgi:large subunit ribosomal protein L21e
MGKRKGGFRRGTRYKFQKATNEKGKISFKKFFQKLDEGNKVQLKAEPAYQKGMYFPRYHGFFGIVTGKAGECYTVAILDHDREKTLIVHPVHLKKVN